MLAVLADAFGWGRADLDALTAPDARWWMESLTELRRLQAEAMKGG